MWSLVLYSVNYIDNSHNKRFYKYSSANNPFTPVIGRRDFWVIFFYLLPDFHHTQFFFGQNFLATYFPHPCEYKTGANSKSICQKVRPAVTPLKGIVWKSGGQTEGMELGLWNFHPFFVTCIPKFRFLKFLKKCPKKKLLKKKPKNFDYFFFENEVCENP